MSNLVSAEFGRNKLVAFLDILGFKNLIAEPERVANYFNKVIKILDQLKATNGKQRIEYALISDSIVLSFPYEDDIKNVNQFLIALGRIQAELCLDDIWLRGAVTIGKIKIQLHESNQIVFGQALSDAYTLENKFAKFPRIIFDPRIFNIVSEDRTSLKRQLKQMNKNSNFFSNILYDPMDKDDESTFVPGGGVVSDAVWINYLELVLNDKDKLDTFTDILRENLYSGQEHYEKYKWVQNYALSILHTDSFRIRYEDEAIDDIFDTIIGI